MKADKKDHNPKEEEQNKKEENTPRDGHSSQGHNTGSKGSATSTQEPTLRSATTDSTRVPKKSNDDLPTGGNIR